MAEVNCAVVPKIPVGVSGTALAASLLRDGWSVSSYFTTSCCETYFVVNLVHYF